MLFVFLLFFGIANPTGLRLLDKSKPGEIAKTDRRRLRTYEFDFIDEDDVGLNKVQWDKPHKKARVRWVGNHHHRSHKRGHRHHRREKSVASSHKRSHKKKGKSHHHHKRHGKHGKHRHRHHGNHRGDDDEKDDKKEKKKADPESGDNILKKVQGKKEEKKENKDGEDDGKQKSKKEKLNEKIVKLSAQLKAKIKFCKEKKCAKDKNTVECLQCELSQSILALDNHQAQCELKCLKKEEGKKCSKECFTEKAKALYTKMEKYLENKKGILAKKCDKMCEDTGKLGNVYNCWKCRMSEQMTRVARCRHLCQHKVKEDQKGECFPACLTAVQENVKKLMDADKKRQKEARNKPKKEGQQSKKNPEKGAEEESKKNPTNKNRKANDSNDGW